MNWQKCASFSKYFYGVLCTECFTYVATFCETVGLLKTHDILVEGQSYHVNLLNEELLDSQKDFFATKCNSFFNFKQLVEPEIRLRDLGGAILDVNHAQNYSQISGVSVKVRLHVRFRCIFTLRFLLYGLLSAVKMMEVRRFVKL